MRQSEIEEETRSFCVNEDLMTLSDTTVFCNLYSNCFSEMLRQISSNVCYELSPRVSLYIRDQIKIVFQLNQGSQLVLLISFLDCVYKGLDFFYPFLVACNHFYSSIRKLSFIQCFEFLQLLNKQSVIANSICKRGSTSLFGLWLIKLERCCGLIL